jgi:hypothetical protein
MKTSNPHLSKILTFLGLICLTIPLSIQVLWIYVFNLGTNQTERVEIFHSYFPVFLHGKFSLTYLSMALGISAIILASIGLKLSGKLWKALNIIVLVFSILLLLLNIFSIM